MGAFSVRIMNYFHLRILLVLRKPEELDWITLPLRLEWDTSKDTLVRAASVDKMSIGDGKNYSSGGPQNCLFDF